MNIDIYKKLITILFIGFLSTFFGEIKAEEICFYKNQKEFSKCSKKTNIIISPKYPIEVGKTVKRELWEGTRTQNQLLSGGYYNSLIIKALNEKEIQITKSKNIYSTWHGLDWRFKNPTIFNINGEDIISWEMNDWIEKGVFGNFYPYIFKMSYLNSQNEKDQLIVRSEYPKKYVSQMLKNIIKDISNLSEREERVVSEMITKKLLKNEKKTYIIQSIIKISRDDLNNCIEADGSKYPELVGEYRELSKTINPLRAKLDLPPSSDLKPVCN